MNSVMTIQVIKDQSRLVAPEKKEIFVVHFTYLLQMMESGELSYSGLLGGSFFSFCSSRPGNHR